MIYYQHNDILVSLKVVSRGYDKRTDCDFSNSDDKPLPKKIPHTRKKGKTVEKKHLWKETVPSYISFALSDEDGTTNCKK